MSQLPTNQGTQVQGQAPLAASNLSKVKHIIAVFSGKGGVGKSTVAVNLAASLSRLGLNVGLLDADVYGPSAPKLLHGLEAPVQKDGRMLPVMVHGFQMISMGLLTHEDSPVIWRGPMASKLIQTFLMQVEWGALDFLIVDMPPGTGDVQLTLAQQAPIRGAVIVSTPQELAVSVTIRGMRMFEEVKVPIIGMVENMSGFVCGHCHEETAVLGSGNVEKVCRQMGIPFLGKIPLDPSLATASDLGTPFVLMENKKGHPVTKAFEHLAQVVAKESAIILDQTVKTQMVATSIDEHHGDLVFEWSNGQKSMISKKQLRYQCDCAMCVDEVTGVRKIRETDIPSQIRVQSFRPVGKYGLQLSWSDGHNTGIYTFNRLKQLTLPVSS